MTQSHVPTIIPDDFVRTRAQRTVCLLTKRIILPYINGEVDIDKSKASVTHVVVFL